MTDTVVTAFLRHRGRVLLVRTDEGWDALSTAPRGEESVETAAWRRVHERLGAETTTVRSGGTLELEDRRLHPVLLDVDETALEAFPAPTDDTDGRHGTNGDREWEWVHPPAILRRETVPGLWRAYERVAPTVRTVVADDEHGSTWLSVRALEALRDRAGLLAARDPSDDVATDWTELAGLADRLRTARPGMAAVENRVNRAMSRADDRTAAAVETAAVEGIERAVDADREAAAVAAERVTDRVVLTLSRSGTVLGALRAGDPAAVSVAESRPGREGVGVAETLANEGERVTLHTDAAVATVLAERADVVLVGADAVRPDGAVVNKTGTRTVATAAAREDVPVYVAAASDKVATSPVPVESGPAGDLYDGDAPLSVFDPLFDTTPPDLIDGVVTERGTLSTEGVARVADELRALAAWDDDADGAEPPAERGDEDRER